MKNGADIKMWNYPTGWRRKASKFRIKPVKDGAYFEIRTNENKAISMYSKGNS